MRQKVVVRLGLITVAALAVACSGSSGGGGHDGPHPVSVAATTYPGLPVGVRAPFHSPDTPLAVFTGADKLSVTIWGSGSCPYIPTKLVVLSPDRLAIQVAPDAAPSEACTADLRPTTSDLNFDPAQVARASGTHVTFRFAGEFAQPTVMVRARVLHQ